MRGRRWKEKMDDVGGLKMMLAFAAGIFVEVTVISSLLSSDLDSVIGISLAVFIPIIILLIALILSKKDKNEIMGRLETMDKKLDRLDEMSETLKEMRDTLNEINRKLK